MMRFDAPEKLRCLGKMKLRVARLDANKETIRGGMREAVHVEHRMMRLRQPVQGEHTKNRGERRAENGELKGDGNESRPAIEGAAPDVQGISDGRNPVLKTEAADAAGESADQGNQRHHV